MPRLDKNESAQVLRAVAIFGVILIHTCPPGITQVYVRPFVNHSVPLFLFLSGFLTSWEQPDFFGFIKRRLKRVLIPYLFWTVVYTLATQQPERLLQNAFTSRAAYHLYYIPVYLQFVVLIPLMKVIAKSKYRWVGWVITPVSILCFEYSTVFLGEQLGDHLSAFWYLSCLGWFSFYYFGLILGNNHLRITNKAQSASMIVLPFLLIVQIAEGYLWFKNGAPDPGTPFKLSSLFTTICIIIAIIPILCGKLQWPRWLILIGDCSFGMYLSHVLLIWIFSKITILGTLPFPINAILVLLSSLAFVISFRLILGERLGRWIGFA